MSIVALIKIVVFALVVFWSLLCQLW